MKCIIAEKPSVAQSIAKIVGATKSNDGYLEGNDYLVTWAYGHLVMLAIPANTTVGNNSGKTKKPASNLAINCPKCNAPLTMYPKLVKCNSCDFKVWREICGVRLNEKELEELISAGQLENVDGFKSKKGNTFSAGLRLNLEENKVEFVFNSKK